LEEFSRAEGFTGIDIFRTVRRFDPRMPCPVHLSAGGRILRRDAITCVRRGRTGWTQFALCTLELPLKPVEDRI
jgi:hypothetical protein